MGNKKRRLSEFCIWDSERLSRPDPVCSVTDQRSKGALHIVVRKDLGERLLVYHLKAYVGEDSYEGPDWLLVGKVRLPGAAREERWVVVIVELKSGSGWRKARDQIEAILPMLGKGGEEGGEQHHQESRKLLPVEKNHLVIGLVVGHVGAEMSKIEEGRRKRKKKMAIWVPGIGDRERIQKVRGIVQWGRKKVIFVSPTAKDKYETLASFFEQIGGIRSLGR